MDEHKETGDCNRNHKKGRLKLKTVNFVTFSDQRIIRVIQFNKNTCGIRNQKKSKKEGKKHKQRIQGNRTESEKVSDEWHYNRYRSNYRKRWKE